MPDLGKKQGLGISAQGWSGKALGQGRRRGRSGSEQDWKAGEHGIKAPTQQPTLGWHLCKLLADNVHSQRSSVYWQRGLTAGNVCHAISCKKKMIGWRTIRADTLLSHLLCETQDALLGNRDRLHKKQTPWSLHREGLYRLVRQWQCWDGNQPSTSNNDNHSHSLRNTMCQTLSDVLYILGLFSPHSYPMSLLYYDCTAV